MDSKKKVTISWSGGKDSAFALYKILLSGEYEVVSLHTLINAENRRVGMHGVHEEMIETQAQTLGIPLYKIYVTASMDHKAYEGAMHLFYQKSVHDKIEAIVFGDIFLEDLKKYREDLLSGYPFQIVYPLWGIGTTVLIQDFFHAGFKTLICSANKRYFSKDELGKVFDQNFLSKIPSRVDPCGENGEFHTWVYDGPIFRKPLHYTLGDVVEKAYTYKRKNASGIEEALHEAFWIQDILRPMV